MSLVVGEAIAYKRVFKPISPCKNNWELFADQRRSVRLTDNTYRYPVEEEEEEFIFRTKTKHKDE